MRMRHIVICGLSRSTIFLHIISKTARFWGENVTDHKMCILISSTNFVRNISNSKKKWATYDQKCILAFTCCTGYCCQYPSFLSEFNETWVFFRNIFEKYSYNKFYVNACSLIRELLDIEHWNWATGRWRRKVNYSTSKRESELLDIKEGKWATGHRRGRVSYWTTKMESELLDIEQGKW
jgi:hypothetical protein